MNMIFNFDDDTIAGTCLLVGREMKKTICMEECAELVQAISKGKRDEYDTGCMTGEHFENEIEEIADVLLCIRMLIQMDHISSKDIQKWIDYKQSRQMQRDYLRKDDWDDWTSDDLFANSILKTYWIKCEEANHAKIRDDKESKDSKSNGKLGKASGEDAIKPAVCDIHEELLGRRNTETEEGQKSGPGADEPEGLRGEVLKGSGYYVVISGNHIAGIFTDYDEAYQVFEKLNKSYLPEPRIEFF